MLKSYGDQYRALLHALASTGYNTPNQRTGVATVALGGGFSLQADLAMGLPVIGVRKTFPKSAAAEIAWFMSGKKDVTWLARHAPLWNKFVEPGTTEVAAAYGYRWSQHFGRDQIRDALLTLGRDPTSRQCVVSAWDPATDGLGAPNQPKNIPCPAMFALNIVGERVHMSVFIRSSDVIVGLPYDVMGHALLLDAMARSLGRAPGVLHMTLAHAHIYSTHFDVANQCAHQPACTFQPPALPGWTIEGIQDAPDHYVADVQDIAKKVSWPTYNPKVEPVQ